MPKGGFGNLIALPPQKHPRDNGFSAFVDADLIPYRDQWAFLASIQPMALHDVEPTILQATGGIHPLDVTFIDDEDLAAPWKRAAVTAMKLPGHDAPGFARDTGQSDLFREECAAASTGQSPDPAGGLPKQACCAP